MMYRFWYILHQNNKLLTVQTVKEPLIISSTDKEQMQSLMRTIQKHKISTAKWINKCRMYNENVLHLTEQKFSTHDNLIQMAYLDMKDVGCMQTLRNMYDIHNMRIFMMSDFTYTNNDEIPLLSIHGMALHNGPLKQDKEEFISIQQYLEFIYNSD